MRGPSCQRLGERAVHLPQLLHCLFASGRDAFMTQQFRKRRQRTAPHRISLNPCRDPPGKYLHESADIDLIPLLRQYSESRANLAEHRIPQIHDIPEADIRRIRRIPQ
jgi:hypothetical protein